MSAISGQDIFRRLTLAAFVTLPEKELPRRFFANCSLCGDQLNGVCCGCTQILCSLTRSQKKHIYRHLIDLEDKERAERLARLFTVHRPKPRKAKIKSPTKDNPGRVEVFDVVALRKTLGLSQAEMAEKLQISRRTLCLAEQGKRPLPARTKPILDHLKRG
jgi:DNA-binding XRE family transcriptional regulator